MLEVIAYIAISLLVILAGISVYIETQRKKAIEIKKKAIILRLSKVKSNFKGSINHLVKQDVLTIKQHESIFRIANNFFIFQAISANTIEFFEHSLNNVISALSKSGPESIHYERVQEQISLFVLKLPTAATGFNSHFYSKTLPKVVQQLVDAKEDIYNVDSTLIVEDSITAVISPARSYLQPFANK